MNLKFTNAKQAREVYEYKNTKQKLHRTIAAIWYNKSCRDRNINKVHLVGVFIQVITTMYGTMNLKYSNSSLTPKSHYCFNKPSTPL